MFKFDTEYRWYREIIEIVNIQEHTLLFKQNKRDLEVFFFFLKNLRKKVFSKSSLIYLLVQII